MIKPTQKTREYTRNDLIKAIGATILCLLVVVFTSIIKFYIIGQPVSSGIWSCILTLSVMMAIFMGGLLMFVLVARTEMIKNVKSYLAHLTVVTVTFVIHLFVSIISPLLMLPGLSAMVILQISRQKHDAFIFNLLETMMIMCVLLLESVMTEWEVLMLLGGGDGAYLWYLGCISLVGVGSGAFLPLLLQNKTRRVNYLIVGFFQMLASAIIFVLTLLVCDKSEIILTNFWMPMLASALTVIVSPILFPIIEGIFNLVTENRLIELTNSSQPLLRKLAIEAPGTYNHSLTVSNFAEMCATAIGEDPYLARAAAYYHDIGKLTNPSFFAENQSGYNPHDDLLPEVSAEIIRNHTTDGYQILKASRIPEEIAIVAIEHQGTLPITVFYPWRDRS